MDFMSRPTVLTGLLHALSWGLQFLALLLLTTFFIQYSGEQGCGYARFLTASEFACENMLARADPRALPTFARAIRFRIHRFRILAF